VVLIVSHSLLLSQSKKVDFTYRQDVDGFRKSPVDASSGATSGRGAGGTPAREAERTRMSRTPRKALCRMQCTRRLPRDREGKRLGNGSAGS